MKQEQIIEKVIEETSKRLKTKQKTLVFDDTPTENSNNPVTSDGIKKYMDSKPSGGTNIEINPSSTGSKDLNSIQIDNTKYKIETGTKVQGNVEPSGVSIRLKSVRVNGTSYNFPEEKNISSIIPKSITKDLNKFTNEWEEKTWAGLTSFNGSGVWTDGDNIYYSYGTTQRIFDRVTSSWIEKEWIGMDIQGFWGNNVWTDGDNIYYSDYTRNNQYILNKTTSTWTEKTWTGFSNIYGAYVWTDGDNIYYSVADNQYILDKSTSTWNPKTWNNLTEITGENIWTDGDNIYYSNTFEGTKQYVLDKATSTWYPKTWYGLTDFEGVRIWTDGDNIYLSFYENLSYKHYVLDKKSSTWIIKEWTGLTYFDGHSIWTDGKDTYCSSDWTQYVLKKNTLSQTKPILSDKLVVKGNPELDGSEEELTSIQIEDNIYKMPDKPVVSNVISKNIKTELSKFSNTWKSKVWTGYNSIFASNIWTDGENIYYSDGTKQYVLDKATSTWNSKTWNGSTNFTSSGIWTDGDNIYYSYSNVHRVLDKTTSTWSTKTWTGLTSFYGSNIWTDGENIYYSEDTSHYVLDKSTSTWTRKTWYGLTDFYARYIWTDGDNIYHSNSNSIFTPTGTYMLDKDTSTWHKKTWTGLTDFDGNYIWTDGDNVYYSNKNNQYILNKSSSTWNVKVWKGITSFRGSYIWTDKDNIYYYNETSAQGDLGSYILNKNTLISTKPVLSDNTSIKVNDNSAYSEDQLHTLTVNGTLYKVGFDSDILIVNNMLNTSNVVSWDAPDLTYFTDCNPTLSYLVYVNDTLVDTITTTSIDVSSYLVSGDNTVRVKVKANVTNPTGVNITVVK